MTLSNAQFIDDMRYLVEHAFPENRSGFEFTLREFASVVIGAGISPPAQQTAVKNLAVPAAVLVGNPINAGDETSAKLQSMGYDLEALERDNPYNQWMREL